MRESPFALTHPSYSGWIGTVAAVSKTRDGNEGKPPTLDDAAHRLAAVAGTSTCHLAQSKEGIMVPGYVSSRVLVVG